MPGEPAKRREHETAIVTWIGTNTYPKASLPKYVTFHVDIVDRREPGEALPELRPHIQHRAAEAPLQTLRQRHVSGGRHSDDGGDNDDDDNDDDVSGLLPVRGLQLLPEADQPQQPLQLQDGGAAQAGGLQGRGPGQCTLATSNIFHAIRYFLKVPFSVSGHPLCGLPCWLQERTVQAEEVRVKGESGQRGDSGGPARLQNQVSFLLLHFVTASCLS